MTALESQAEEPLGLSKVLLEFSFLFCRSAENIENANMGLSSLHMYPANPRIKCIVPDLALTVMLPIELTLPFDV